MFIRRKTINGKSYQALVESYRIAGRKYSRTVCSLGGFESLAEAIADTRDLLDAYEFTAQYPGTRRLFENSDGTVSLWPCGAVARQRVRRLRQKLECLEQAARKLNLLCLPPR